jgi:diacylglycerol kinase family enzyme
VENLAREFKDRGVEILGISGGDGTNHVTLTTFFNVYGDQPLPTIAFLRGGTMNNLANTIGVKGSPEKILSELIIKYHEDLEFQTIEIDTLKVNDKYGFIFGMGMASRFIDDYNSGKGKPSPMRAVGLLGKTIFSSIFHTKYATKLGERFDAMVEIDGKQVPFKNYSLLFAGTLENLGFNFKPLYRARQTPGEFQFVGISATPRHILFTIPKALLAKPCCSSHYLDEVGKQMVIKTEKPLQYMIDGDPQPATDRFEISVGPRITCIVS